MLQPNPLYRHNPIVNNKPKDKESKEVEAKKTKSKNPSKQERIKQETLDLYSQLSQDEEERKSRIDIRDKIIELNYSFFGYVASHTFVNNTSIEYADKFQCALLAFCEIWWWYKWEKKTSKNFAFTVYFKPRLSEMVERYLSDVKYSLRRSLCIKAADQLGIHWAKLRYEDLAKVKLPIDEMNSLKAMFGAVYWADLEDHEAYIPDTSSHSDITRYLKSDYNDVETMLMQEMILEERQLTDADLVELSYTHSIPYEELRLKLPIALERLHEMLLKNLDN